MNKLKYRKKSLIASCGLDAVAVCNCSCRSTINLNTTFSVRQAMILTWWFKPKKHFFKCYFIYLKFWKIFKCYNRPVHFWSFGFLIAKSINQFKHVIKNQNWVSWSLITKNLNNNQSAHFFCSFLKCDQKNSTFL